ncbi:hypothetical protein [Leptolyngbya sp. FACHB-261]|uniref:hypothetical protein n=1 Tax=Leptolyngbya sp. FACHB-261 TaxID=2692806 RepID=UPI001684D1B9|nr:hypothetical protein [Leptolyngbya sp. FACHB-261]MBD2099605.1 hypothetical protein [Leptolyngbya sp. FACHB-261]
MIAPEQIPTPAQMACWQAEAAQRWPDYQLHLAFRTAEDGTEYSLWLSPRTADPKGALPPLVPNNPNWQPIELFWSERRSYLEFLFEQFPDQADLASSSTLSGTLEAWKPVWVWAGLPAVALAVLVWRVGVPVPYVKLVPIRGITVEVPKPVPEGVGTNSGPTLIQPRRETR